MNSSWSLGWNRLLAFALDYLVMSAYLVFLVAVSVVITRTPLGPGFRGLFADPTSAELTAFALLVALYDHALVSGLAANPPPERPPGQRGRLKQSPTRKLLERLLLGNAKVLAFLDDFTVPFDNNQAEQDLRMLKVQQKIAGPFRADSGAEAFSRIRGYLSSLRKQRVGLLGALETVFTGQPLSPALA